MSNLGDLKTLLDDSFRAVSGKGVAVAGAARKTLPAKIAEISVGAPAPTLPDLVGGGTYYKRDGEAVVITPIAEEETAFRLLVAPTGAMRTALFASFPSGATCTVDWGDGSPPEAVTRGVDFCHQYDGVNGIPRGDGPDVYLITLTGPLTYLFSSANVDLWRSGYGNIVSVAVKSPQIQQTHFLTRSNGGVVQNTRLESIYIDGDSITSFAYTLAPANVLKRLFLRCANPVAFHPFGGNGTAPLDSVDLSMVRINGVFNVTYTFANATSILFNPENTELGDITLTTHSMQRDALVALFESLPPVAAAKNITLGKSPPVMELTDDEISVATAKNWNVIRG